MRANEVRIDNLTFIRSITGGEQTVLKKVNAVFGGGQLTVIVGDTGVGKSTLLHILGGLHRPTSGAVIVDGEPISRFSPYHRDLWRRQVGIALQTPSLVNDLTVRQNIVLPLVPRPSLRKIIASLGERVLKHFQIDSLAEKNVSELSGGERQRVVLARALVSEPNIVIADEPTAFQDEAGVCLIKSALAGTKARGATAIVASHDKRLIDADIVDTRYVLIDGSLRPLEC